jgi:dynein heavy chain
VVNDVLTSIASVLNLCGPSNDESHDINIEEIVDKIHSIKTSMSEYFEGLDPLVVEYIESLKTFDHLWQDDINASLTAFQEEYPTQTEWKEKVMYYVNIEKQISCLPTSLTIGPILLITFPMRATLQSISSNWKSKFASHLHRLAKTALDTLVDQQKKMMELLTTPVAVEDLPFLKEVLELLEHIDELQHSIDEHYIPVEDMYNQLNEFNLTLERTESEDIKSLRQKWNELTLKATEVHSYLLIDQRMVYAQETVRQVKEFVVQTIQFRNAFDTEGPLAPGLTPNQAVVRVGYFMNQCKALQIKRELLDTIQKLMNIPLTVYHELKQTQEELSYLSALYSNYQSFISFDESFRSTLWSVVDIDSAINEVEGFWSGFFSLPPEQQEWEASRKLSQEIMNYRQTLPLLRKLHNKEIRNRHWIQIMNISNFNFPLETKLLKLNHLLEANLLRYTGEIKGIIENAQKEQEMEYQFLAIEEEWLEQVFHFDTQELPLLSPSHSMLLLESLDSTQTQLTVMLMSKHIDPLRNEAAQWVGKLGTVAEVLQLWLSVQELWLSLEPVYNDKFSSEEYADDNLEELHDFCEITETWVSLMNKTLALKNCIQCCITCDEPILPILQKLKCDLEKCKESLATYLIEKRNAFPRLYFIPNDGLLTLLSNSMSINHIKPYLGSLFGNIVSLTADSSNPLSIATVTSAEGEKLQLTQEVLMTNNIEDWLTNLLKSTHVSIRELLLRSMDNDMPSLEELIVYQLTQVACISMHHQWTKDNELALVSCRYDRRALPGLRAKFNNLVVMKLSVLLTRMTWKQSNEPITHLHRIRMETLTVVCLILLLYHTILYYY